jgi:hypothetical protein
MIFLSLEPDPGFGMKIPDHFSESLEQILGLKIFKFFFVHSDPGSGIFLILDLGSGINIPDPQHCRCAGVSYTGDKTVGPILV